MRALMRLSDRIVVLHHGEMITEGPPDKVVTDPLVQAAYFGRGARRCCLKRMALEGRLRRRPGVCAA